MVESSYFYSYWSRGGTGQQRLLMGDPSEIRGCAFEPTSHRVHQQGKCRTTPDTTGLAKRQHPLYPAIALLTTRPSGPLAPHHPEAKRPFRCIARGVDAWDVQEQPQHLLL
jgi:hypothetical protein